MHARSRAQYTDAAEVERRVDLRMRRQAILIAPGGPTLWAVLDEAALRRSLAARS